MTAKLYVESTSDGFVLKSAVALHDLHSAIKDRKLVWHEEQVGDGYTYSLSKSELALFFDGVDSIGASIAYTHDGKVVMISLDAFDVSFGANLTHEVIDNIISIYVSVSSTLRVGWNWRASTGTLLKKRELKQYEMTPEGLRVDFFLETRCFKASQITIIARGAAIGRERRYVIESMNVKPTDADTYQHVFQWTMPMDDLDVMRQRISLHELGQKMIDFTFVLEISEYAITQGRQIWTYEEENTFKKPLIAVSQESEQVFALVSRMAKTKNLVLMPVLLSKNDFIANNNELVAEQESVNADKVVLLDQGTWAERQDIRELFKAYVTSGRRDVFLITDGRYECEWLDQEAAHVIYGQTNAHVKLYPQIKTVIGIGNRHAALPLAAEKLRRVSQVKKHVFLVSNPLDQIRRQGMNPPETGDVHVVVASKQNQHLMKQLYPNANIHLIGLPFYSKVAHDNSEVSAVTFGLAVSEDIDAALRNLSPKTAFKLIRDTDNLHQYHVVLTDNLEMAEKVSSLGIPVVYIDENLTPDTVDHYYRLAGPAVRDIQTGWTILRSVFAETFNFVPYIEHAQNNLNEFHDDVATQRIMNILSTN
jgi:hypothetical protein